jgi:hypothetical protein
VKVGACVFGSGQRPAPVLLFGNPSESGRVPDDHYLSNLPPLMEALADLLHQIVDMRPMPFSQVGLMSWEIMQNRWIAGCQAGF